MANIIQMIPNNCVVADLVFHIGKIEKWWIAFNDPQFRPQGRKHLIGNWYIRVCKKDY